MRENTKFIVAEVNKFLGRNYNVIYFNSLSPEELLQVSRAEAAYTQASSFRGRVAGAEGGADQDPGSKCRGGGRYEERNAGGDLYLYSVCPPRAALPATNGPSEF